MVKKDEKAATERGCLERRAEFPSVVDTEVPQLLLLDVVMPKKSGKAALEELRKTAPHVKALFIGGYSADMISTEGVLEKRVNFISKPVSPKGLLRKVREVLDG